MFVEICIEIKSVVLYLYVLFPLILLNPFLQNMNEK